MKKLLGLLLILGLGIGFVACNEATPQADETVELSNDTDVFTVEALSAATLLDYSSIQMLSFVPLAETTEEPTEEVIEEEIDEIDKYLEMMQTYLGDNQGLSVEVLESDLDDYEFLVSFTTVDAYGNEVVYKLYYNETVYEEPIETEEPVTTEATTPTSQSEQEGWFVFDDEDDELVVYSLTGLIVYGDVEYEVEGKKMVDEDGSIVTLLRAYVDCDNFVKVSYKTDAEDGNTKFFYEVKEDGVITNKSKVHVVYGEDGAVVVHLTFVDETQSSKYTFSQVEEEGQTIIRIKYDIRLLADDSRETGNIHIFVTVDPETGEMIYEYKILESQGEGNGPAYRKTITKRHRSKSNSDLSQQNKNV